MIANLEYIAILAKVVGRGTPKLVDKNWEVFI